MPDATLRSVAELNTTRAKQFERANVAIPATYKAPSGTAAGTVIRFARVRSFARVHPDSALWADALGGGTLALGFTPSVAGPAGDPNTPAPAPNALITGVSLTAAKTRVDILADHANAGKTVWELMGLDKDPDCFLDVIGTTGGTTTAEGDITLLLSLYYG